MRQPVLEKRVEGYQDKMGVIYVPEAFQINELKGSMRVRSMLGLGANSMSKLYVKKRGGGMGLVGYGDIEELQKQRKKIYTRLDEVLLFSDIVLDYSVASNQGGEIFLQGLMSNYYRVAGCGSRGLKGEIPLLMRSVTLDLNYKNLYMGYLREVFGVTGYMRGRADYIRVRLENS